MKTKMFKIAAVAFALVSGSAALAAAGGDIYEIRPCLRDGTSTESYATAAAPMNSGVKLYFNMRLYARNPGFADSVWKIKHKGATDELIDDALFPLQMGIYVSGTLTYATLVEEIHDSSRPDLTDLIFEYTTKPGDFAMPITLATMDGPATDSDTGSSYYLNPARTGKWEITNENGDTCNLWYYSATAERLPPTAPDGTRNTDYSLRSCGFYVKTIDFDSIFADSSVDPAIWRTVHQGSTIANPASPKLAAPAPLAEETLLYVWSDNESAVKIEGGVPTEIVTGYDGGVAQTTTVQMGRVTMAGGAVSADFAIKGVAEGGAANLVLSAWPGYRYDASKARLDDEYLTRRVTCIEPLPASVVVEADRATAVADSDFLVCKARLSVYVTQPYNGGPIEVTVNPAFTDGHTGSWGDYVRFSTTSESVQTLPDADAPPKVTIPAGSTDKKYIYVYTLRGDAHTTGVGHQMKFEPAIDPAVQTAAEISTLQAGAFNISAAAPVVTKPNSSTDDLETIAGSALEIPVCVSDTYADMTDAATGYTVEIRQDKSSSWTTLGEKFVASGEGGALIGMDSGKPPSITYNTSGYKSSMVRVTAPVSGKTSEAVTFPVLVNMPTTSWCETTDDKDDTYVEGDTVKFKISLSEEHGLQQSIYAFLLCNEDVDISMFGGNPCIITNETVAQSGTTGRQISKTGTSTTGSFTVLDGLSDDDGGQTYSFSVLLCKTKSWDPAQKVEGFSTTEMINILVYNKEPVFDASEPVVVNGFPVEADGVTFGNQMPKGQKQTIQPQFNDVSYDLKHGFVYKWTASCDGAAVANGTVQHSATATQITAVTNKVGGTVSITKTVPEGININTVPIDYAFAKAGIWTIKIQMRDKDMSTWSVVNFSFNIEVIDSPQVSIEIDDLYQEDAARAFVHVGLGGYYTADDPIVVKLTVAVPTDGTTNPGIFTLDRNYKAIPAKPADQAAAYPPLHSGIYSNEYYVVFENALDQDILIEEMDGTDNTARRGVTIRAEVVTKTTSTDPDKNWDEYYLPNNRKAYVQNVAPTCNMQEENTNAWVVSGGFANAYPIRWGVYRDVAADFTNEWTYSDNMTSNGVRVTILGCVNEQVFYVTNTTSGKFVPNFGTEQGEKNVTIMVEDKDGDYRTYTYRYMVVASKFLTMIATGPSGGSSSSGLSQKYALAKGKGEGHTYVADGAIFMEAKDFRLKWNCSRRNDVDIYGFGYKVASPIDNGSLDDQRDIAINKKGNATADVGIKDEDCYHYSYALQDQDSKKYDSYFYLWMTHVVDEEGKYQSMVMGTTPAPERPAGYEQSAGVIGVGNVALPRTMLEDGSYVNTLVEGIFSREWRVADNLGDINQDGVPDVYAIRTWGGGNLIKLHVANASAEGSASPDDVNILDHDLRDLATSNLACDRAGTIVGDFLPQIATADGLQDFTGGRSSYAPIGQPFTTLLQLRGFHTGLNAIDLTMSRPEFSKDEQKAWCAATGNDEYDESAVDLSKWSPEPGSGTDRMYYKLNIPGSDTNDFPYGSFIYSSTNRYEEGVEAVFFTDGMTEIPWGVDVDGGLVLTNDQDGALCLAGYVDETQHVWKVGLPIGRERLPGPTVARMDPTLVDTDGDGFPDGWEYFFWYQAHVEYPARGNNALRRPGQRYAFERFNFANVVEGTRISAEAVQQRFDPCKRLSAAAYRKFPDFDGDGLSDLEELAIGTNPCHWDTDGDKMCDGWEVMMCLDPLHNDRTSNADKDFMAYRDLAGAENLFWVDEAGRRFLITNGENPAVDLDGRLLNDIIAEGAWIWPDGAIYGHRDDAGAQGWGRTLATVGTREELKIPAGSMLQRGMDAILIHSQVHDAFGFDPRTAWSVQPTHPYVAARWNATLDPTGLSVNTRPYYAYDEYLLSMHRGGLGIPTEIPRPRDNWNKLRYTTTNPSAVTSESVADDDTVTTNVTQIAALLAQALQSAGSSHTPVTTHGADTDLDGVPDGWELYTRRNPNIAAGSNSDEDGDGLSFVEEYAGTDSCDVYSYCATIAGNNPGKATGWYNKFFPTDPDDKDSDGDGIPDGHEGTTWGKRNSAIFPHDGTVTRVTHTFIYGSPTDNGSTIIRGGGMNPCTVDTDQDGLPDGWEMQFAGVVANASTRSAPVNFGDDMWIGDGVLSGGNNVEYIAGGMDATWPGDAVSDANNTTTARSYDALLGVNRDVDFDRDGLQNWQEYLVQTLRHLRYDDISTPLMGRLVDCVTTSKYDFTQGAADLVEPYRQNFWGFARMDASDPEGLAVNAANAWGMGEFVKTVTVTNGTAWVAVRADDGSVTSNLVYITGEKTRVIDGQATIDERRGFIGRFHQYGWNVPGWRRLGYFAPAKHYWDRSNVNGSGMTYLMPPADADPEMAGTLVGDTRKTHVLANTQVGTVTGYVSTDPRRADTDIDGMDDYWEVFHGLNPILGTSVDMEYIGGGATGGADIIAEAYGHAATFNAYWNEWTHPDYNTVKGRDLGMQPTGQDTASGQGCYNGVSRPEPIGTVEAFDPVLYPWIMGTALVDPDGDGLRNGEERAMANLADPVPSHTDPSPLWFTERTTAASYVYQYYILPSATASLPFTPSVRTRNQEDAVKGADGDFLSPFMGGAQAYSFSFEESEGYDTDNDMLPDGREIVRTVRLPSDPLQYNDPDRRQALYLSGENSYAVSYNPHMRVHNSEDFLKQFTVECWVRPEKTGVAQTLIDRCSAYPADAITKDFFAIRSNFRIGLAPDGRVYGMFDNTDAIESGLNQPASCQRVDGQILPLHKWSHVALTYDGSVLSIYIDGNLSRSEHTTLIPANGCMNAIQNPANPDMFTWSTVDVLPNAFLIGARPKKQNVPALFPYYIDSATGEHRESFDNLQEYANAYIDEVRVWDGARTQAEIAKTMKTRMLAPEISANRESVYQSWLGGATRNNNDGRPMLPPELVLHYNFTTLPGEVYEEAVATEPPGFMNSVIAQAGAVSGYNPYVNNASQLRLDGLYANIDQLKGTNESWVVEDGHALEAGWWRDCLTHNTVYNNYHVVPWIENGVEHLPHLDGSSADTFRYSDTIAGLYTPSFVHGISKFVFPNTGMPYQGCNFGYDRYQRLFAYDRLVSQRGDAFNPVRSMFIFGMRTKFLGTSDLIPLGGANAKRCPELWDGTVADAWELSGQDTDGDGLPDWWEEYARQNYFDGIGDSSTPLNWDTEINYNGRLMPAYQAYWTDLYRGLVNDGASGADYEEEYVAMSDRDENNIPDWWEDLFGVAGMDPASDPDNDGISIYSEYLLSFGPWPYGLENGFPLLDPLRTRTGLDQKVTDYFLPGPTNALATGSTTNIAPWQYVGEIATDHDYMEDWWENQYAAGYSSSREHDPDLDRDEDGWSNYSEVRAMLWGGSYVADLIDRYTESGIHEELYPKPAIGLRIFYAGEKNVSGARLVVRTSSAATKRMDATFVVPGGRIDNVENVGVINPDTVMHGFMSPGNVLASSVTFSKMPVFSAEQYIWNWDWYVSNGHVASDFGLAKSGDAIDYAWYKLKYPNISLVSAEDETWTDFAYAVADALGKKAKIFHSGTNAEIGSIDLATGEWALDTTLLAACELDSYDISKSQLRVAYSTQAPASWPKTYWLSGTKRYGGSENIGTGAVKEGSNYIEAFMDLNSDGAYTAGEPFAAVRNVDVSWHKTGLVSLELTETTPSVPRYNMGSGSTDRGAVDGASSGVSAGAVGASGTVKFSISRQSINGRDARKRKVFVKNYLTSDRNYITEGDVLSEPLGRFDLDWNYLVEDAVEVLDQNEKINKVVYSLDYTTMAADGTESTRSAGTFLRVFGDVRPVITPVTPAEGMSVVSCTPEFAFTCDGDEATAFRMQILDENDNVVWDSQMRLLPASSGETSSTRLRRFTAPIYIGCRDIDGKPCPVEDGKTYKWRVAAFNAAFPSSTFTDADWSDAVSFKVDIASTLVNPHLTTGFGSVAAAVRYYGPCETNALEHSIVVEAYASADFSGRPLGRTRVDSLELLKSVADIATTNAVIGGVEAGEVFLMAYIDTNRNGKRDKWESWGYVNKVGSSSTDLYTPVSTTVLDSLANIHSATIYIEDCDINRNEILDLLEPGLFPEDDGNDGEDGDRDGLGVNYEEEIGTSPNRLDTDGDGMPDGWEYIFANGRVDPLDPDANLTGKTADPMAYAEIAARVVTLRDTATGERAKYVLPDWEGMAGATMCRPGVAGVKTPAVGENMAGTNLWATYEYGGKLGLGRLAKVEAPSGGAYLVDEVGTETVVLVHAQVYDWFGYDARTASASGEAVNTKTMTALDKYLVVRYLEAIGLKDVVEDTVNTGRLWSACTLMPGESDFDRDGIADGWELYVMFGTNTCASATNTAVTNLTVSPWNYADARKTAPGAGSELTLLEEFDRGLAPTDPWQLDSDRDGILDKEAYKYQIKTGESQLSDLDRDGLSNWAEYLASKKAAKEFRIDDAFSATSNRLDYFETLDVGGFRYYIGESEDKEGLGLIADHDFVDDAWEDLRGVAAANRYVYDALRDADGNGWSNWAENRAMHDEATWVQTGTTTNLYAVVFDLGTPVHEAFLATNKADVLSIAYYHSESGVWNNSEEGASQVRYTLSAATPVLGYGGRPVPWVELTVKGIDSVEGLRLVAYRDPALAKPVATFTPEGTLSADGTFRARFRGTGLEEGKTTFVATIEGKDVAGFVSDVDVGYSLVELEMSLRGGPFVFTVEDDSNAKKPYSVVRTSINGVSTRRIVYSRRIKVADGKKQFTLADFMDAETGTWDADWRNLVSDAKKYDFSEDGVTNATYEAYVDGKSVASFARSFTVAKEKAVPVMRSGDSYYRLLEARPTFSWKAPEGYPAFALQIATNAAFDVEGIVHSETNATPAMTADGIATYSPEVYVGRELEDGKTYFWRVALLDAAHPENAWSDAAEFRTAVNVDNADTGYGRIGAEIRYYGPATNGNIVVGVYKAGDFAMAPVASKMLTNDLQAITNDLARPFAEIATNAPAFVTFDGVAPGDWYVMAYVDSNTNGVRDAYETWGYANGICDSSAASRWQPAATNVVSTKAELPAVLVVMEDTDVNQNNIPDCLEARTMETWTAEPVSTADADRDGLADEVEDEKYGTDPAKWDTDGDGMPDGYEAEFAWRAVDSLHKDGDRTVGASDLMAYAEIEVRTVTLKDTETGVAVKYILPDDARLPRIGDNMVGTNLYATYEYGDMLGVGRLVKVEASSASASNRVDAVEEKAVAVLVHAQVYDCYGFSALTCVTGDDAVNTKIMTALDKYLVARYFEAIGLKDMTEDMVNTGRLWSAYTLMPNERDFDRDGIPDGWELYVMFGTNTCASATNLTVETLKISPWNYDDARETAPGDGSLLALVDEYDRGDAPTDPWRLDSDGDGISDFHAFAYHLKRSEALADADGDGLSNYAEYLLSEVFDIRNPDTDVRVRFDPDDAYSVDPAGVDSDYFWKIGELYVGEIFSDHDMVEDWLEERWGLDYASMYQWDALSDGDEDRWSTYAEARYNRFSGTIMAEKISHYSGETEMRDAPKPTLNLTLRYNGFQDVANSQIVVKTYAPEAEKASIVRSDHDAVFVVTPGQKQEHAQYIGEWSERTVRGVLSPGHVLPASLEVEFAEFSTSDKYTVKMSGVADVDSGLGARYPDGTYVMDYSTYVYLLSVLGTAHVDLQSDDITWSKFTKDNVITVTHDSNLVKGYICLWGVRIGEIDLVTGEYSLDLRPFKDVKVYREDAGDAETAPLVTLQNASFRIKYETLVPTMQSVRLELHLNDPASGYVKEGTNTVVVIYDRDGSGDYTAGEPMAVVNNILVGWDGATAEIELTDTSPVFTRMAVSGGESDRAVLFGSNNDNFTRDGNTSFGEGESVRMRIYRYSISFAVYSNNMATADSVVKNMVLSGAGKAFDEKFPKAAGDKPLVDKWINLPKQKFITEKDILETGAIDIDWDDFYDDVVKPMESFRFGTTNYKYDPVNVGYVVLFGNDNQYSSSIVSVRKFDWAESRERPRAVSPGDDNAIVYTPQPEFKWSMRSNDTYTAFRVQVLATTNKTPKIVWDSGVRRAMLRDSEGNYRFKPDLFVGDGLENNSNYYWRVSMYNSKFKSDFWSENSASFRMNCVDNGFTYGSIPVCVRYFGPSNILSSAAIVVEAHERPDFTDEPVARYSVTNKASAAVFGSAHEANVVLSGIPKGKYYIRAWLDLDAYGQKRAVDRFEAWGCHCAREADPENAFSPLPVAVDFADGGSDVAMVYIEDVDTNQNNIPDTYEIVANKGRLDAGAANVDATIDGDIAIRKSLAGGIENMGGKTNVAEGLQTTIESTLKKKSFAALSLGVSPDSLSVANDGSIAVEKTVEGVEISDIGFDAEGNIVIAVEASLSSPSVDSAFYTVTVQPTVSVTCKVYRKTSLAEADWTLVSETPVVVGAEPVAVSASAPGDGTSGFYKVVIE